MPTRVVFLIGEGFRIGFSFACAARLLELMQGKVSSRPLSTMFDERCSMAHAQCVLYVA